MTDINPLYIDMRVANSIFTATHSAPQQALIGILRGVGTSTQSFEACDTDISDADIGADDIAVIHSEKIEAYRGKRLLTVRTDTRGVMQLHAYRCSDEGLHRIDICTEKQD